MTSEPAGEIQEKTEHTVLTCFVPTTPNPTSGFIVMVPRAEVTWLEMSVEDAMRLIISLGVVAPDVIAKKDPLAAIDPPPIAATPAADPTDGTEDDRAR